MQIIEEFITAKLRDSVAAKEEFAKHEKASIIRLAGWMIETIENGGKILIFGNGGSAADAQHMAAEFVNRFMLDRRPLPAIALTTDTSILTSCGNDFSFNDIFAKQVQALGIDKDLALGISTSGNSPNVINAINEARKIGMKTAGLTGGSGGKLIDIADLALNVPTAVTPHIQETHLWVEHLLCWLVDEIMFGTTDLANAL